jgi:hypothetical protein|nr:MAG TPA: holin protein [Caudoviricetes sp.]
MSHTLELAITVATSVLGSSGLWAFIQAKNAKNAAQSQLMVGLAHIQLVAIAEGYIARGWITHAEYDDIRVYLYDPYRALGGNGSAQRLVQELSLLPSHPPSEEHHDKQDV